LLAATLLALARVPILLIALLIFLIGTATLVLIVTV
jgi:hypothetical protein